MTTSLYTILEPLLERLSAKNIKSMESEDTQILEAIIYDLNYTFKLENSKDLIRVTRGEKKTSFLIEEIEMLDHINMPYIQFSSKDQENPSLSEQRSSDIALRLHLIMEGDIYMIEERVIYIGAGTQRSSNFEYSRT
jgi:hypothetical protein